MKSTNFFGVIAATVQSKASTIARQTCSDIVTHCRIHSRVDTGEMRDGWQFEMEGPTSGVVFNDSDHVLANEYGTINMPAQPMLAPSIDEVQQSFDAGLAKLLEP